MLNVKGAVSGAAALAPVSSLTCRPNRAQLSDRCTRLSLYVDVSRLKPSVDTEDVCNEVRKLVAIREATKKSACEIVALCDLKTGYNDTVEVTVVS